MGDHFSQVFCVFPCLKIRGTYFLTIFSTVANNFKRKTQSLSRTKNEYIYCPLQNIWVPQAYSFSPIMKPTAYTGVSWSSVCSSVGTEAQKTQSKMIFCLLLSLRNKLILVFDPGVLGLMLTLIKLWQANLLSWRRIKNSDPSQFLINPYFYKKFPNTFLHTHNGPWGLLT